MNGVKVYCLVLGVALAAAPVLAAAAGSASDPCAPEPEGAAAAAAGNEEQPEKSADERGQPRDGAAVNDTDEQLQALRSHKARDGGGYGAGPGGERGLGSEGSPHHRQYGSPPGDADE
jgi:hypothetical protein